MPGLDLTILDASALGDPIPMRGAPLARAPGALSPAEFVKTPEIPKAGIIP